jgi:DNA-binding transcriptional ArsR family regulator
MVQRSQRLERLITEEREAGTCCDGDVDHRIATLEERVASIPSDADRDRAVFKVLSNETRYTIVHLLTAAERELCVCEITPVVDVSDSAVSHALSDLHDAGLVTRRSDGTWRYYAATERASAILDALKETRPSTDA